MTAEEQSLVRGALRYMVDKLVFDAKYCPDENNRSLLDYDLDQVKKALEAFDRTFTPTQVELCQQPKPHP